MSVWDAGLWLRVCHVGPAANRQQDRLSSAGLQTGDWRLADQDWHAVNITDNTLLALTEAVGVGGVMVLSQPLQYHLLMRQEGTGRLVPAACSANYLVRNWFTTSRTATPARAPDWKMIMIEQTTNYKYRIITEQNMDFQLPSQTKHEGKWPSKKHFTFLFFNVKSDNDIPCNSSKEWALHKKH